MHYDYVRRLYMYRKRKLRLREWNHLLKICNCSNGVMIKDTYRLVIVRIYLFLYMDISVI